MFIGLSVCYCMYYIGSFRHIMIPTVQNVCGRLRQYNCSRRL